MITTQLENGRNVILYEDGRWEYIQESDSESLNKQEYDFRQIDWGASKEQVKASETAEFSKEVGCDLFYTANIHGIKATIIYAFKSDRLNKATVKFEEKFTNPDTYLIKFYSLKVLPPALNETIFSNYFDTFF